MKPKLDAVRLCWIVFAVGALLIYGLPFVWLVRTHLSHGADALLVQRDFVNYWVAGQFTVAGQTELLFEHDRYFAALQSLFGANTEIRSWSYPPHFLLFTWPLGFVAYKTGLVLFLISTLALFAIAAVALQRRLAPHASVAMTSLACVGYVAMMLAATQNGFLISAAILFAIAFMNTRPALAGFALACVTVKPQLGFLLPLLAIPTRNWALLFWAALFTCLLVGVSVLLFGWSSWQAYVSNVIPYQQSVMSDWDGIFLRMMPSTFGSLRTLSFAPDLALEAQLVVSVASLAALAWLLPKMRDDLQRAFLVLCTTFLITPYSFNYDMGALVVVAACLAQRTDLRYITGVALPIALVAVLPGVMTNLGRASLPIAPLVLTAALFAVRAAANGLAARESQ